MIFLKFPMSVTDVCLLICQFLWTQFCLRALDWCNFAIFIVIRFLSLVGSMQATAPAWMSPCCWSQVSANGALAMHSFRASADASPGVPCAASAPEHVAAGVGLWTAQHTSRGALHQADGQTLCEYKESQTVCEYKESQCASTKRVRRYESTKRVRGYVSTKRVWGYVNTKRVRGYLSTKRDRGCVSTKRVRGYVSTDAMQTESETPCESKQCPVPQPVCP